MSINQTKNGKRIGRPPRHGGYSIMTRRGDVPARRRHIREYLEEIRAGLVRDLGPKEEDITTAQRTLINHLIGKIGIVRLIEEHLQENGIFKNGELDPALGKFWLTASNSLRLDLQALGINTRKGEGIVDLGRYLEAMDKERPGTPNDNGPAPGMGGGEIAPHNACGRIFRDDSGSGTDGIQG